MLGSPKVQLCHRVHDATTTPWASQDARDATTTPWASQDARNQERISARRMGSGTGSMVLPVHLGEPGCGRRWRPTPWGERHPTIRCGLAMPQGAYPLEPGCKGAWCQGLVPGSRRRWDMALSQDQGAYPIPPVVYPSTTLHCLWYTTLCHLYHYPLWFSLPYHHTL